jgi:fused signal recognition particle receptor
MFDVLKKKIGGFVDKIIKKEEKKEPEEVIEEKVEKKKPEVKEIPKPPPKPKEVPKPEVKPVPKPVPKKEIPKPEAKEEKPEEIPKPPEPKKEIRPPAEKPKEEKRVKLGIVSAVKSIISKEVEIREADVKELLDNLELELLEGDVSMEVSQEIIDKLREELIGAKVEKGKLNAVIKDKIRSTLAEVMEGEKIDIVEFVRSREKPVKIVFLGINGAGKTTTIAKIAKMLMDNGLNVVFAASDTFRAAAIEQIGVHADRLGVKVIKRDYGSDPTSVAYDAANYAKAHGIDAILIDTAGRQDTNINLINELKKMDRVLKPDLKIYVGESIAGHALMEQVSSFNKEIGVDGVILTKLDCDAKGGTILSVARTTGVPIIYIGTGQKYEDLEIFDADKIADRIVS